MTTLIPFGNYTLDGDETLPQAGNRIREEINASAVVDFGFHFILQNRPSILRSLPEAMNMGFKSFKMFMTYKKRPGRMCDDDYICEAMEMVARGGGVLQLHCESGNIIEYLENKLIADGHTHPEFFPVACPDWAEEEAINRAIAMAGATRCPTYVVHLSTHLGLERIKQAQAMGQPIWTETCPQYLLLSDAEMAKVGPLAKIGPPLRPEDGPDRDALWAGLQRGHISIVASDHSPHPQELKKPGWDNIFVTPDGASVPFGSPGIETLAPLMYSEGVVKRGMPITWLARDNGREPGPHLRPLPPQGRDPARRRRRPAHPRPRRGPGHHRRRPHEQRRLHPVRGLGNHRPPVYDPAARPGPAQRRQAGAAPRLRPVHGVRRPNDAAGRCGELVEA